MARKLIQKAVVVGEVVDIKINEFRKEAKIYLAGGEVVFLPTGEEFLAKYEIVEDEPVEVRPVAVKAGKKATDKEDLNA
jgi:alpha-glucosidase (family GH31 glycosyl hydrolase)